MSKKIIPTTSLLLILTISGYAIQILYVNIFSSGFLIYYKWPDDLLIVGALFCFIGSLVGFMGIFEKRVKCNDRFVRLVCTLLCLGFLVFLFSSPSPSMGREKARRISCASTLKYIGLALQQYAMDYNGFYPPENGAAGLETLRKNDYLTDYVVYLCPSSATEIDCGGVHSLTEDNVDYVYVGGLKSTSDPNLPLAYDKVKNHDGYYGNVLYANGTVKGIEGDPWTENIEK
ncbi:MAG: DUF1559 domain-containing protein [Victivallaceae bacterium]